MDAEHTGKRKWSDLSGGQRAAIIGAAAVQLTLLGAALNDLRTRPADQLNGPKPMWVALSFVNFIGPISYFLFGRKGPGSAAVDAGE